jgi:hypothetical protein
MRATNRRSRPFLLGGLVAILASCAGTPAGSPGTTPPSGPSGAGTSSGPGPTIEHPTGADDVVISLRIDGGFVAPGVIFGRMPRLVLAGDGSVYFEGAQIEIYPQPLLPPVLVSRVEESVVQRLLDTARRLGLLRTVTYGLPPNGIADAPSTTVTIAAAAGGTWVHDAYALGLAGVEVDPARAALAEFVDQLAPLVAGVDPATSFVAARYAIRAIPADQAPPPDGIAPNEVVWPTGTGVTLAAAADCATVDRAAIGSLFDQATQITRFVDEGVKYVLTVRPMVPGDPGC